MACFCGLPLPRFRRLRHCCHKLYRKAVKASSPQRVLRLDEVIPGADQRGTWEEFDGSRRVVVRMNMSDKVSPFPIADVGFIAR